MKLLVSTVAPYKWIKLDKTGAPVEKGQFTQTAFFNTIPRNVSSVIGVAPGNATTFHSVEIPAKKRANMLAAVPYALEESLSEDVDQLHFTVLDWTPEGFAHVMVIAKALLQEWIKTFSDAGVEFDNIISELSLLPIHPVCDASVVKQSADSYAVKSSPYKAFICDQDAFNYWWEDQQQQKLTLSINDRTLASELRSAGIDNVSHWPIGDDFRSWTEQAPELVDKVPQVLHGDYEPEHLKPSASWLNIAAGLAACALVLLGGSHWVEASKLQKQVDENQQEIRALFEEAFPNEEYLDRPRRQLASLLSISEGNPASEVFQYLLGVVTIVVPENQSQIEEINFRDEQLQIGVVASSFAALEQMTAQINEYENLRAVLISSGSRAQRVIGQIKLALGDNG